MTYIKITLPELDVLKEQLKNPKKLEFYKKYDVFQGPSESVKYILTKL